MTNRRIDVATRLLAGLALVAGVAAPGAAQGTTRPSTPPVPPVVAPAAAGSPVVIADDTLFRLYARLGAFSAEARAAAVAVRLRAALGLVGRDRVPITVTDHESDSELAVRDKMLMTVLDADATPLGQPRTVVARQYARRIDSTLVALSAREGTRALLIDTGLALAATAALVVLLLIARWGFARIYRRIHGLERVRLPALRIQEFELLSAGRLSQLLLGAARLTRLVLTLLLFYVYVPLVLSFFPWTSSLSGRIVAYALTPFAAAWAAFVAYLPNIFYLAAGVVIARFVLKFVRSMFEAMGSGAIKVEGFHRDWADPSYKIARVMVLAFAAMALYPFLPGAGSDAFKGVSIFLGVFFSLGSSAAIGNVVAGVVLTYTNAFRLGDRVRIGDTVGDVVEKTLLVTRLRTIKNVAVTIPNGAVLGSQVVNYSTHAETQGLILHTAVTIGYDAPWRQVHALLIDAARATEDIRTDPPPFVLQTSLDDFYVTYELNAYTDRADQMAGTYSRLHQNIQDGFNAAGVEIMSPHYATLRDGNEITIPVAHRAADYRVPGHRVTIERAESPARGDG
ncbi:MAG: mechanosensitive ion channel domain-containing protein [Gemmatimonadaceae bacterium]